MEMKRKTGNKAISPNIQKRHEEDIYPRTLLTSNLSKRMKLLGASAFFWTLQAPSTQIYTQAKHQNTKTHHGEWAVSLGVPPSPKIHLQGHGFL